MIKSAFPINNNSNNYSTGQPASLTVSDSPVSENGESFKAIDVCDRIKQLEELVAQLQAEKKLERDEIASLKALLTERENEWKKREGELIAAVEAQRKSFTSLVSSKDQEIEALKHELHTVAAKRIKTLEEQVAAKDKELTEIKHRLSDKELELLELREKEYEQSSRQERLSQFAIRDAQRRAAELEEQYNKLKDRYFFALAINVKMSTNNSSLDLNSLYDEAKELCLPPDQWQDWLLQKGLAKTKPSAVANDDSDSEKEDVEGF